MIHMRHRAGVWLLTLSLLPAGGLVRAAADDESILHEAGLSGDGPSLVAFFQARARLDVEGEQLRQLLSQFAANDKPQRAAATTELIGLGPVALQALRQTANDFDHPDVAERAAHCLPWLEGPSSHKLLIAAAHRLAESKPQGAADALLAYLPYADNPDVLAAVRAALAAVAARHGKPEPALLRGLNDRLGIRRAAAGVALCRAVPPDEAPDVRKLLRDRAPEVRLRAARALAEAHDAEAIPVLIDLLAESSADQRQVIEEALKELAGEWAPNLEFPTDDEVSRGVRRDAWAAWWHRTEGPALLAVLAKHTLTADKRRKLQELLAQLGSDDFHSREEASRQLLAFGRLGLPLLREANKTRDAEAARRAKLLIERVETGPDVRVPLAALRLLSVRKPAGAVEALLAYLPFAEDEDRQDEVRKSLTVLARRDGKLDPALRHALADARPEVRAMAAEALIQGGGPEGHAIVGKLLSEDAPAVRLRLALALTQTGGREGVSVLIDLLPLLSKDEYSRAEEALYQLAGDNFPEMPNDADSRDKRKCREAWAAWWKLNSSRIDPSRLKESPQLGYTVICDNQRNRVYEVDRQGKQRWVIENVPNPIDAVVLPGNRVLIAENGANRVTERDLKGNILWKKEIPSPVNVQRLPNGHTFIASFNGGIVEVDRSGKTVYTIPHPQGRVLGAHRTRRGEILCLTMDGRCLVLDTTGKQLKELASGFHNVRQSAGNIGVRSDGHILIARTGDGNLVTELNGEGKIVKEWKVNNALTASPLPNGHLLIAAGNGAYELDRAGKIHWQYKIGHIFRARRR